ncbi:unnamed protein product [Absidia cylindrospora]
MMTDSSHPYATFPTTPGKGTHSLRPYYTPGINSNGNTFNYTSIASSNDPSYQPVDDYDDLIDSRAAARELINFSVLKFLTTAVSNPFEVSKTLMQVQYIPHEDVEILTTTTTTAAAAAAATVERPDSKTRTYNDFSSSSDDDDDDDFYGDHHHQQLRPKRTTSIPHDDDDRHQGLSSKDVAIGHRSVYDDATRPSYQIQPIDKGVWQGIGRLMKQPHEGWRALFKGQYTNWLYEICHLFLQPTVEGSLNDIFGLYDDTIPLVHLDHVGPNLATLVSSHLLVGILLSPLELIRTRLIVQSASPLQRKYKGPVHALRTILEEEGGLKGLYMNHNLWPTIFYHALTPLLRNTTPLIIDRVFRISANDSTFLYGLAELGLRTLELVLLLPLETIRKRLQCQLSNKANTGKQKKRQQPLETVVAMRPVPYTGMVDAAYRIVTEEGGRRRNNQPRSVLTGWGWRGLYQGFSMQCTSNIVLFVLHAVSGMEDDYEDF